MPASVMRCFGVTTKILSSRSRHSGVTLGLRGYEYWPALGRQELRSKHGSLRNLSRMHQMACVI